MHAIIWQDEPANLSGATVMPCLVRWRLISADLCPHVPQQVLDVMKEKAGVSTQKPGSPSSVSPPSQAKRWYCRALMRRSRIYVMLYLPMLALSRYSSTVAFVVHGYCRQPATAPC